MGRNFAFRDYFKQAMEGRAYMTGITVGSVAGRAGVFYSRPVLAADGHSVIGAVVLRIRAEPIERCRTSEEVVVSKVGRELYEKFFRGYTRKQWERDPSELHASVCARIPLRTNTDDRYFTDWHQAMPADGYTAMFERVLDHPSIEVQLETDYFEVRHEIDHDHLVFTGATPVEPSPTPKAGAQPATSGRTGDAPAGFLVAAVIAALVVIVLAVVLVLRDLRAQGRG